MTDETIWVRRLAELAGVGYVPPENIDKPRLQAGAAKPEICRYDFDGKEHVSLSWTTPQGSTSASPSSRWFSQYEPEEVGIGEFINYLYRGLELPGTPSDYHFAIQSAHTALWKRRSEDPAAVQAVEHLCLLDLALVEAYPDMLQLEYDAEVRYAAILAFERLIKLYERAGDIEAALDVARRAQLFGQERGAVERLEAKINALRSEEADEPAR